MSDTIIAMPDGRDLGVREWGVPDGSPLFVCHGTPGSSYIRHAAGEYERLNIRAIAYDRPGYGLSTRVPGRTTADTAADIEAIADRLGIDRFAVFGVSGGGAHALAAAALLPERVTRCATVVGLGPARAEGLDFLAGASEAERSDLQRAMADPTSFIEQVEFPAVQRIAAEGFADADLRPAERDMMHAGFVHAIRQGPGGMIDDHAMSYAPWGFDPADIRCPTRIMIAEEDVLTARHGVWLAATIPAAELITVPGGHIGPRQRQEEELLAWLTR